VKGISYCPLFWRRFRGRRDWKLGVAADGEGRAGHYIGRLITAYHAYIAKEYKQLEDEAAPLCLDSSQLVQDYHSRLEALQLASSVEAGGATGNIRARNASRQAARRAELVGSLGPLKSRLVAIDEQLLHAENAAAARCREAGLLAERHIRAYLHGMARAAGQPLPVEYSLQAAFDAAADFAARHEENTQARRALLALEGSDGE